jgi:hypothetical protein
VKVTIVVVVVVVVVVGGGGGGVVSIDVLGDEQRCLKSVVRLIWHSLCFLGKAYSTSLAIGNYVLSTHLRVKEHSLCNFELHNNTHTITHTQVSKEREENYHEISSLEFQKCNHL